MAEEVSIGGALSKSAVSLRICGDDLDPAEVTALLGCEPHKAASKGAPLLTPSGKANPARTGIWLRQVDARVPGDIDAQIAELLAPLSDDPAVWSSLKDRFTLDIYCGLFLEAVNEGLEISPQTMRVLADRGLTLGLDIYYNGPSSKP